MKQRHKHPFRALVRATVAGLATVLASCGAGPHTYSDAGEFLTAYTGEKVTRKKHCLLDHCFEVSLHSPSYILAREWSKGVLADTGAARTRGADLLGQLRFVMSITTGDGLPLEPYWNTLEKEHFSLRQGDQRVPCSFFYDETVPGLHRGRNVHLTFDTEHLSRGDFHLVLDHPFFGIATLEYNLQSIYKLPQFTIKSTAS